LTPWIVAPNIGVSSKTFIRRYVSLKAGHPTGPHWSTGGATLVLGIRFFAHGHGYSVYRGTQDDSRARAYRIYNKTDGVIVVANAAERRLAENGIVSNRISIVPCNVDLAVHPVKHSERSTIRCTSVGRIVTKKGPILTLTAFRKARKIDRWYRVDVIGGPLLNGVRRSVEACGLSNVVSVREEQPHAMAPGIPERCDIFCRHVIKDPLTGNEECLPAALSEAMAAGLPPISTRHSEIPQAINNGRDGFILDERDGGNGASAHNPCGDPESAGALERLGSQEDSVSFPWQYKRADARFPNVGYEEPDFIPTSSNFILITSKVNLCCIYMILTLPLPVT
jgi:glycosyltransferase involved in cell wall biosynthesis